jgi:hypothetical protein
LSIIEHFIAVPGLPKSIISDEDIILSVVKIQFLITDFFGIARRISADFQQL